VSVENVAAIIEANGQTVTLRRVTGTQQIPFDVDVKASVRNARPDEVIGNVTQFDRVAIISPAEIAARQWPGPPRRLDRVIIEGVTTVVEAAEPRNIGEETALYVLALKG